MSRPVPVRTTSDANSAGDINTLSNYIENMLSGDRSFDTVTFTDTTGTTGLHTESGVLKYKGSTVNTGSSGGGSDGFSIPVAGNVYVYNTAGIVGIPKAATVSLFTCRFLGNAPAGANYTCNFSKNGLNDMLRSDLVVTDGSSTGTASNIDSTYGTLTENDSVVLKVTQVGSSTAGSFPTHTGVYA
jgi:hypothetical protein